MREPKRLQRRPHYQGMPVPSTLVIEDGVPDFTTPDGDRVLDHVQRNLCHLCGERLRVEIAFVGGVVSMNTGMFRDGPLHLECARFSFFACPFVAGRKATYRYVRPDRVVAHRQATPHRPDHMALWVTQGYSILGAGDTMQFIAHAATRIEWDCEVWARFSDA
ncbi:MAG: hypothetical protein WD058_05185 [Dehalococcoidia bacterium]